MERQNILVCDDEEGVRKSAELILSDKYNIIYASSGREALGIIKNTPNIKAVLLDIKMPHISGIEILKEIKQQDKELPVIIVTGYQSFETAAEAIKYGASNYVVKPLESKTLLEALEKAVL